MGVSDVLKDSKQFLLLVVLLAVVCVLAIVALNSGMYGGGLNIQKSTYTQAEEVMEEDVDYQIVVKTIYGDILIDLYENLAPESTNSLLFLASKRYYDDLTFHKVIKDFVIQTGDATATGNGNPGYNIPLENSTTKFGDYSVGMANASQFFIALPNTEEFEDEYTLVGEVVSGFDVVDSISKVEVDDNGKPINDVEVNYIQIIEE